MLLKKSGTDADAKCANLKTALDTCAAAAVSNYDIDQTLPFAQCYLCCQRFAKRVAGQHVSQVVSDWFAG